VDARKKFGCHALIYMEIMTNRRLILYHTN